MTPRLLLLLTIGAGALVSCTSDGKTDDSGDTGFSLPCSDAVATFQLPTQPLSGDIEVGFNLANPLSEVARVELRYALEGGDDYLAATVTGELSNLATSPEGAAHSVNWLSLSDLGYVTDDAVSLKLLSYSDCGTWAPAVEAPVVVANEEVNPPTCDVELAAQGELRDGVMQLDFTLVHDASAVVGVTPEFSTNEGANWQPLHYLLSDCDGDGSDDGVSGLDSSPEGVAHCLTWDSEADVNEDLSVQVRLSCVNGGVTEDESTQVFEVNNDPTPGPGEVIITESLTFPTFAEGSYIEVFNTTNHVVNLHGVGIRTWLGTRDPDSDNHLYDFQITDGTQLVALEPGGYRVFARSRSEEDNGCLDVEKAWGNALDNRNNTHVRLLLDGTVLASLSQTPSNGWPAEEPGVAVALDPAMLFSDDWNNTDNWCYQTTLVPECTVGNDTITPDTLGTPGAENDPC